MFVSTFATRARLMALALSALALPAALAHRIWIVPSATQVDGNEPWVAIDAAISENLFEFDTNPLPIDVLTIVAPDGSAATAENRVTGRRRTSFDLKLVQKGTYRISAFNENLYASYQVAGETKRWRGSAAALAGAIPPEANEVQVTRMQNRVDTYVTHDKAGKTTFAALGVGLELVPQTPPTDLSVGDTSTFRLLLDGRPLADTDVTVLRGAHRYRYKMGEIALKTDAQGLFSVKWPEAGRYWIGVSHGGRGASSGTVAQPARRSSCSTTVEVLPP